MTRLPVNAAAIPDLKLFLRQYIMWGAVQISDGKFAFFLLDADMKVHEVRK